ncbi:MAG TPA: type II CAAX endopeptidase family protein [Armatimonadota bacterium]|nr:type II CAAX endopeptidase family protein [Armatimonadota bacterium]
MQSTPEPDWKSSLRTIVFAALAAAVLLSLVAGELTPFVSRAQPQKAAMLMRGGDTFMHMYYLAWDANWGEAGTRVFLRTAADFYQSALRIDPSNFNARLCTMFTLRLLEKPTEAGLLVQPLPRGRFPEPTRKAIGAAYAMVLSDQPAAEAMETAHDYAFTLAPGPALIANGYRKIGDDERAAATLAEAVAQARPLLRDLQIVVLANGLVVLFGIVLLVWAIVRGVRRRTTPEEPAPFPTKAVGMREATEALILWVFFGAVFVRLAVRFLPAGGDPSVPLVLAPTVAAEALAIGWVWIASGFRARFGWALSAAWRHLPIGVGAAGAAVLPVLGIYTLFQSWLGKSPADDPIVPLLVAPDTLPTKALLVVGIGLVGPMLEETLFRGILFGALRRQSSFWPAAAASSALFALAHLNPAGLAAYFALGLVFAYLVERTRSLVTPWAAHAAFNLFNLAMLLSLFG